jgi:uncharacterized OB-fold protein
MVHIIDGVNLDAVKIGMKVQAVFASKTTHTILDIDHFAPV